MSETLHWKNVRSRGIRNGCKLRLIWEDDSAGLQRMASAIKTGDGFDDVSGEDQSHEDGASAEKEPQHGDGVNAEKEPEEGDAGRCSSA